MEIDPQDTHVSGAFQGTITHMVRGRFARARWFDRSNRQCGLTGGLALRLMLCLLDLKTHLGPTQPPPLHHHIKAPLTQMFNPQP